MNRAFLSATLGKRVGAGGTELTDHGWEGGIESRWGPKAYALYGSVEKRSVRTQIRNRLSAMEGGEGKSITLRRIMRDFHGVDIGLYTDGGCFIPFAMPPNTTIGRYSSIAHTADCVANHPMNTKSSHALFYNPVMGETDVDLVQQTHLEIGSDVWLGHNSIVLNTVSSIGHGAIIGAGSVVHKDVPPYALVVGHPARVVRYRFSEGMIEELLAERWWEKSLEQLKAEGLEKFQVPLEGETLR